MVEEISTRPPVTLWTGAAMSLIDTRHDQMFPVLSIPQIETAMRFASDDARRFAPGELVFDVGERQAARLAGSRR